MRPSKANSDPQLPSGVLERIKAANFGWWELDLISQQLTVSDSCKKNFGRPLQKPFSYAELVGAVHTEDFVHWRSTVEASISTGDVFEVEYRAICPDGEIRWVKVQGSCVRNPNQPDLRVKMAGISRDITAEKKAKTKGKSLEDTMERAREFVAIFDLNGRPFYANQTALSWSGSSSVREFSQRDLSDSLSAEQRPMVREELLPKVLAHGSAAATLNFETSDGQTVIPLHLELSLLKADDRPVCVVAIGQRA